MTVFMKKITSKLLTMAILVNLVFAGNQNVHANCETNTRTVFVEGVEYSVTLDEENNILIKAITPGYDAEMVLDENLEGEIQINNEEYNIDIKEIDYDSDDIDVVVCDEDNNVVEEYEDTDELIPDDYCGQVAIAAGGGTIAVGTLVTALLYASLAITIAGVTCYAVDAVISDVKKNSKYYYKAYQRLNTVFINPVPISAATATKRIASGSNTYTFTSALAKSIVKATGLGVTKSENHWAWYKIGSYFNHYHTKNRNGAQSFYGVPL